MLCILEGDKSLQNCIKSQENFNRHVKDMHREDPILHQKNRTFDLYYKTKRKAGVLVPELPITVKWNAVLSNAIDAAQKKDNKPPSSTPIQQTKISLHQIVENKQKEDDEEKNTYNKIKISYLMNN